MYETEAPGSFPEGQARLVIAFHNYTDTKSGTGTDPGSDNNPSPSEDGSTWHWHQISVKAGCSMPSINFQGVISKVNTVSKLWFLLKCLIMTSVIILSACSDSLTINDQTS